MKMMKPKSAINLEEEYVIPEAPEDNPFSLGALGFDDYAYGEINEKVLKINGVGV